MRQLIRGLASTLAVLGLGIYVGLAFTGSAAAFDGICFGSACHGSGTHTFSGLNACVTGVTRYFVDSFLPAQAQRPRLTSFRVTPAPPCTGATVSAPMVDPWPASSTDPDKRPSGVTAGDRVFRIGWTVNVPAGSKPIGVMKVAWSLAWTEPDPTTEPISTTTTFQPPKITHDFVVALGTPPHAHLGRGQTLTVKVVVSNDGPDASPGIPAGDPAALVFHTSALIPIVKAPAGCTRSKTEANCGVGQLAVHAKQSFLFLVRVDLSNPNLGSITLSAKINLVGCHVEESTCLNNRAYETLTPH